MTASRPRAPVSGEKQARLRAALQSNIARRKAQAHARQSPEAPPHAAPEGPEDASRKEA